MICGAAAQPGLAADVVLAWRSERAAEAHCRWADPTMPIHFVDSEEEVVVALSRAFVGIEDVSCTVGDILAVARNAVVSPANGYGFMDGGIDGAYLAFFGPALQVSVQEAINERPEGHLPVGASIVVRTGHRRIPFLIVAPTMQTPEEVTSDHCYRAMRAVLRQVRSNPGLLSEIYCPGLATGIGRVPAAEAADQMLRAYTDWKDRPT
jgi:O-acetyl-ADP-ribose deacetylase (regulator of RNase III)